MENFDGVWELRIFYTTIPTGFSAMEHRLTLDLGITAEPVVGDVFADIPVQARNGSSIALSDWTDDLVAGLVPFYTTTAEFSRAELWQIPEGEYAGTFISAYEIAEAGTSASTTTPAHQTTFTFRSLAGGSARLQLMETINTGNTRQVAPYTGAPATLASFLIAATSPVQARDNSYIFANIALSQGQNERLFRKRFRQ